MKIVQYLQDCIVSFAMKMITILLKNKHIVLKKLTIYVILCVFTTFCMLYKYISR